MTFSTLAVIYMGGSISFKFHLALREALNRLSVANIIKIVKMIFLITIIIESIGAAILTIRWARDFPFLKALYLAIFHSISAFCNAGFSPFRDNLIKYYNDPLVVISICSLIILGGIGFTVLIELTDYRHTRKLSLHSKVALSTTALLIIGGTLGILIIESFYNSPIYQNKSFWDMLQVSFFQSVTSRTAGFNTINIATMSTASLFLIIILMFIGASPGSTGGGIKTTTFGALMASLWAIARGKRDVQLFRRRIPNELLLRAYTIALIYFGLVASSTLLMLCAKDFGLLNSLFEVVSAAGTVGLSTGITPQLTTAQKVFIIFTMFCGRVGPLTIAMAFIATSRKETLRMPEENILIG